MKISYIKSFVTLCALSLALFMSAQTPHSAYFLDGVVQRHELNPAFGGEQNYVAVPGLSGLQVGYTANFGLTNFVFQRDGNLVTGLSKQVSANEFLGALPENNRLDVSVELPLLSVGFRGLGGFNTIVIKEKSFIGANIPSSLFTFLKQGEDPNSASARYDIENLSLYTNNYVEVALGHSRKLAALEGFSYGAKVKFMVGLLSAQVNMEHIGIDFSSDKWMVDARGSSYLSSGLQYTFDGNGNLSGVDFNNFRLGGFGLGFDLGASYTPAAVPGLTVSLALTDLGFISWKQVNNAVSEGGFEFDGFELANDDAADINEQLDDLVNDVVGMFNLKSQAPENRSKSLQTTLNVGAEYAILDRKISFGILSSTRFGAPYTYAEGMAVVNFRPISWFQASINGSVSNVGSALGAFLNFCPNGVNVFFGCDYISPNLKLSAQGIPLYASRLSARAGIVIAFGKDKKK